MAEISRETLQSYMYNPQLMQRYVLNTIAAYNNGEYTVSDATNPFTFLLECTCANASNAVIEANNIIRKKYPSLASAEVDLYHHLDDDSLNNIFAVPAEVEMEFRVSAVDLRNYGFRPDGANYYQTTIPYHTVVNILDTDFTLLNNIVVKLYDNGTTHVEQQLNTDNDLAYSDIGTLTSLLTYTSDGTPWVHFITKLKQLSRFSSTVTVTASDGFIKQLTTSDKYVNSHVTYNTTGISSGDISLNKSYNDEYIDPYTPTVYIEPYTNNITYRIPEVYLLDGSVSGTVTLNAYTCKGKIYLPINRFMASDFSVTLGDTTQNDSTATSANIPILCNSSGIVNGGSDNLTGSDLRSLIINNTFVTNNLPITDKQIERMGTLQGYSVVRASDTLTNRLYLALRSLPDLKSGSSNEESNAIYAKQDVLFNTLKFKLSDVKEYTDYVRISDDESSFVIKSGAVFKNTNGIIELVSPEEIDRIKQYTSTKLIETFKNTKYYYTPFYYSVSVQETKTDCRVYNLDTPDIKDLVIVSKNNVVNPTVNIDKYDIQKTESGYRVMFTSAGSTDFDSIPVANTKMQLKLPLYGTTNQFAYIDSEYDADLSCYYFDICADILLDDEDMFTLQNGNSSLATKKFTLDLTATIYTLTNSPDVVDTTKFLNSEVYNSSSWVVLTKETINLVFGQKYDYIYTNIYNVYDNRKYKKYENDIPDVYEENVYGLNDKGFPINCNGLAGSKHELQVNILHKKGEQKVDEEGNVIYKHKAGDNILDEDGNPIVDGIAGVIRYIDILMLEYEYMVATSADYVNYREMSVENLNNYLTVDLETMNNKLLENTKLLYKSYKSSKPIEVIISGITEVVPTSITPSITLYMENVDEVSTALTETYIKQIGNIINSYLDQVTIKLESIKSDIKTALGSNIVGVKISGIDPDDNEVVTLKDENNKMILSKLLTMNANNEYIVKYNIDLNIRYI